MAGYGTGFSKMPSPGVDGEERSVPVAREKGSLSRGPWEFGEV